MSQCSSHAVISRYPIHFSNVSRVSLSSIQTPVNMSKLLVKKQKQKQKKKNSFLSKTSKFRVLRTIQFCSNFTSMWSKCLSNDVWSDFWLPMSALATVAGKSFNGTLTAKMSFRSSILYYHCWCWHWKSKVSPNIIWKVYRHMLVKFDQNRYGPNNTIFWAFWQKMVNHFWQSVDAILEDVSVTETVVAVTETCSKMFLWLKQQFDG